MTLLVKPDIIVTRHRGLVEAARAFGVPESVPVIEHATIEDVAGRIVLGPLPLRLAAAAKAVIEPDLDIRPEDRGRELTADEVLERLRGWHVYAVRRLHRAPRGAAMRQRRRPTGPVVRHVTRQVYEKGTGRVRREEWQVRRGRRVLARFATEAEAQAFAASSVTNAI